jgi:hypothetical protein
MSPDSQVFGALRLDQFDSSGRHGRELRVGDRLMAKCFGGSVWYGFVLTDAEERVIRPGSEVPVKISFLDEDGARKVFRGKAAFFFGDGINLMGSVFIHRWRGDSPAP